MIVSASRRTDIPAFYMEWMLNRLAAGYALVRNPMNPKQFRRVDLTRGAADCIIFWSKNPTPLLARIGELEAFGIPFGIGFTLNAYGNSLEPGVPPAEERIRTFLALSARIGPEKMTWRYDPVVFSPDYGAEFHLGTFSRIAEELRGGTKRCVTSFLDFYVKTVRNLAGTKVYDPAPGERNRLAAGLAAVAEKNGLRLEACAEAGLPLPAAACIGREWVKAICGHEVEFRKDPGQRPLCNCVRSIDIGSSNCCPHGCRYCYANFSPDSARRKAAGYDPCSPFLCSSPA